MVVLKASESSYFVGFERGAWKGASDGHLANLSSSPRLGAPGEVDWPGRTSGSHTLSRQRGEAKPMETDQGRIGPWAPSPLGSKRRQLPTIFSNGTVTAARCPATLWPVPSVNSP